MLIKKPRKRAQEIIVLLFCAASFCLFAACQKEPDAADATPLPNPTLSQTPVLTPSDEVTPEPMPTKPLQKSEEELRHLLETEHGFSVFHSEYHDFDGNGTYEMFAFVLETELLEQYTEEEWLYGKLVYFSNAAKLKELTLPFYIWDVSAIRLLTLEGRLFLAVDEAFVSETVSKVYAVYEDAPQCVMSGLGYFLCRMTALWSISVIMICMWIKMALQQDIPGKTIISGTIKKLIVSMSTQQNRLQKKIFLHFRKRHLF